MAAENFKVKKGLEVGTAITATGSGIDVTGIITATQFKGDGSGLTNVVGSGSGVVIKDEGSAVGTAGTINFVGSGVVAAISGGSATVTISSGGLSDVVGDTTPQLGGNLDLNSKNITGNGKLLVGTTSGNNANKIHARLVNGSIPTTSNQSVIFAENDTNAWITIGSGPSSYGGILFADSGSSDIGQVRYNHGTNSFEFLTNGGNSSNVRLTINSTGTVGISSGLNITGVTTVASLTSGRVVTIGAGGKLQDSSNLTFDGTSLFVSGINVTSSGTTSTFGLDIVTRNLKAAGVSTFTGNIDANGNLDVDGQTDLDNLVVSGVGTFSTRIDTNGISLGTNNNTFAAKFIDDAVANFGTDNDLKISHNNTDAIFENTTGQIIFKDTTGNAEFKIQGHESSSASLFLFADEGDDPNDRWKATAHTDGNLVLNYFRGATSAYAKVAQFTTDAGTQLFHTAVKKFETTGHGVVITGVATATSFSGSGAGLTNIPDSALSAVTASKLTGALPSLDGSALTGIVASGSGVVVQHDGSNVGTAGTINFSTNLDVSAISAGIVTVTASGGSSATNTISQGNSSVEVIGSGTDDGEFKILLQDNTYTGAGRTAFRMYQPSASSNFAEFFEKNTAIGSLLGLNATYGGNTTQTIRFSTSNANFMQRIVSETASGQMYFRTKYNGTDYTPLQIGTTYMYTYASISPLTNNTYDLGYQGTGGGAQTLWWRRLYVHNINVGIVTATTRFVGSGVSLTSLNASELDSGTIPNGRFPATLPASSGASLTNLNADNISSGTLASARIEDEAITFAKMQHVGTGVLIGRNDSGTGDIETLSASEVRTLLNVADGATAGITTSSENIALTWDVVNYSGSTAYRFTGPGQSGSSNNPDIYLIRGNKYRFAVNASGHPFFIKTAAVTGTGSQYTNGVTGNGAQSGNVEFYVPNDAPARLYYICQYHGGMVGNLYILGGSQTGITTTTFTGTVEATSFVGDGSALTNLPAVSSDKIEEGNSKVEVADTGTGSITFEVDGNQKLNIESMWSQFDNNLTCLQTVQVGGQLQVADAITHSNNTGTRIRFPENDNITLRVNNNNIMVVKEPGIVVTGILTATTFSGSGASLTSLPAGNLTGTLPSISGANLTNLPSQVTINTNADNRVITGGSGTNLNGESALTFDGSTLSIGAGTATPLNISSSTVSSSSSSVTVDTTAVGSCSAIEYTIFASNGSNIQTQKVLIMDNGTTAYIQEFAAMSNPNLIVSFSADVNSGNVRLIATKESGISGSVSYKFSKMVIE